MSLFSDAVEQQKATPDAPVATEPAPDGLFAKAVAQTESGAPEQTPQGPAPSWSEIPGLAASNAGHSAMELAKNVATPFIHPIETAKNLGNIGLGYMEKAGSAVGLPGGQGYEQYADAVNKMVAARYGSMDNFKRTLATDPLGAAADLSAVLTGGGGLAARAPGMLGRVGEIAGAVGSAVDPLNAVAKPAMAVAKGTTGIAKHLIGERTGAGPEALADAAAAGFKGNEAAADFRENLRGNADIETPVRDAMNAMHNIIEDKNTNYSQGMAQAGLDKPISPSSWTRIAKGIRDAGDVDKFGLIESVSEANRDLSGLVEKFMDSDPATHHTVKGLDALKQAVGDYTTRKGIAGTKAGEVATRYYDAVKDAIVQQAPKYAEVMDNYAEAKDLLGQLQKSFSLPANERKLNVDTALRKLQSVMRNNASTNYGYRKTLLEHLEENGAPNIRYKIAGQALSSKSPRGLSRVASEKGAEIATGLFGLFTGNPALMAGAVKAAGITYLTSTPRLAGEAAYYSGRIAKPISKVLNRPVARAANQLGKMDAINIRPITESRGGAVERALRAVKRKP